MNKKTPPHIPSFLFDAESALDETSLLKLSLILSGLSSENKPYKIDYTTLLMSYGAWKGQNLDEFCHEQTISYFMFNPSNDSAEAREALFHEIHEFLSGK
ncbi:hypothetical protein ABV409_11180 [Flagellimonas sp. DF-77]|uniref:hypothetical protein n=1 Tax=Flagellimonas algarum TaxID=3230298 RepID=UPI00339999A2